MKNNNNNKSATIEMLVGYEVVNSTLITYLSVFGWVDVSKNTFQFCLKTGKTDRAAYGAFWENKNAKPKRLQVDPQLYRDDAHPGTIPVVLQLKRQEPLRYRTKGSVGLSWRIANQGVDPGDWTYYDSCPISVEVRNFNADCEKVNKFCGAAVFCTPEPEQKDATIESMVADLQQALQSRGLKRNRELHKASSLHWSMVINTDINPEDAYEINHAVKFSRPQRDLVVQRLEAVDINCPGLQDLPLRRGRLSREEAQGEITYSLEQLECINGILEKAGYALIFVPEYGVYCLRNLKTGQLVELSAKDVAFLHYGRRCKQGGGAFM